MSELLTVALDLVEQSSSIVDAIDAFQSPPSREQIDAQDRMNGLQRLLNPCKSNRMCGLTRGRRCNYAFTA